MGGEERKGTKNMTDSAKSVSKKSKKKGVDQSPGLASDGGEGHLFP